MKQFSVMQKTFVIYLLYQHSQYAAFDCFNKTDVMIITQVKLVTIGNLKISKTNVKVQWPDRDQRKQTFRSDSWMYCKE